MRWKWPLKRCFRITIVLLSGDYIIQDVWSYDIKHGEGDRVTETSWKWAGKQDKAKLVRADQIAAVLEEPGPLKWRGWRA